jgi:hypothetical protein
MTIPGNIGGLWLGSCLSSSGGKRSRPVTTAGAPGAPSTPLLGNNFATTNRTSPTGMLVNRSGSADSLGNTNMGNTNNNGLGNTNSNAMHNMMATTSPGGFGTGAFGHTTQNINIGSNVTIGSNAILNQSAFSNQSNSFDYIPPNSATSATSTQGGAPGSAVQCLSPVTLTALEQTSYLVGSRRAFTRFLRQLDLLKKFQHEELSWVIENSFGI